MIRNLLYLTASRPDISCAICVSERFQANPKESHLSSVKRIIRYVSGMTYSSLWDLKDTCAQLIGYCNEDFVGNAEDMKSTSGGCLFFGNNLVSLFTKNIIAYLCVQPKPNISLHGAVVPR